MFSRRAPLLTLPLLLAACDAQAPSVTESVVGTSLAQGPLAGISQGLFRIESPMFPFYSRTEPIASVGGFGYRTDDWAAVVFYRDPDCVPPGFDLFQFYDVPGAFGCAPTVDGFALHVEPIGVTPPKVSQLNGDAVPIWFVPWTAFQAAIADEVLTMAELEAMSGLVKGVATQFREHLTSIENHPAPMINITARGYIEGGGSFRYNVSWSGLTVADVKHVSIAIE
jgi:hypothetical protein